MLGLQALRALVAACGVQLPDQGSNPGPLHRERGDIATGPPGRPCSLVLMNSKLSDAVSAIKLSKSVLKNIKENLFWAFFYNTVGIPVSAGLLIPFGIKLSPMLGAAAMSLSSFCVVTNALRLNLIKLKKEKKTMKKTMKIEGMMCPHCEGRVKTALENLPQVSEAVTSHKDGTAIVTLNADIDNAVLAETVTNQGYKVLSVE